MTVKNRALIVVDVQNDFCPGGGLAVGEGDQVVSPINRLMESGLFDLVVATQDFHPNGHSSFASSHGVAVGSFKELPDGTRQMMWPDHCTEGSSGAELRCDLRRDLIDRVVQKGRNPAVDSYSGFLENDKKTTTELDYILCTAYARKLTLTGLATDFCVYYTAKDAVLLGYEVDMVLEAVRGVNLPGEWNSAAAISDLADSGVKIYATVAEYLTAKRKKA